MEQGSAQEHVQFLRNSIQYKKILSPRVVIFGYTSQRRRGTDSRDLLAAFQLTGQRIVPKAPRPRLLQPRLTSGSFRRGPDLCFQPHFYSMSLKRLGSAGKSAGESGVTGHSRTR